MKTFEFTLSEPLKYHGGGENTESCKLELTAPSVKNRKKAAKLKQGFMRCINDLASDSTANEDKDHKIKPEEILVLLQMGSVEYDEYIEIFMGLITEGVCKIEGKVALTKDLAEEISFEAMERLMGEYLVNFILGSLG